ncbi:hypothetical protein [Brevibacillus dissolubilis]|uniref:hypothetical protein n=1 Tax=Brevibacillus dissolubilis TaxID=1844116 RepID=UPI0011165BCF|nr:hypothetical protein [Brevibacillus dissolubilis]
MNLLWKKGGDSRATSAAADFCQIQEALEAHSEIEQADVQDVRFEQNRVTHTLSVLGMRGETRMEVDVWKR